MNIVLRLWGKRSVCLVILGMCIGSNITRIVFLCASSPQEWIATLFEVVDDGLVLFLSSITVAMVARVSDAAFEEDSAGIRILLTFFWLSVIMTVIVM